MQNRCVLPGPGLQSAVRIALSLAAFALPAFTGQAGAQNLPDKQAAAYMWSPAIQQTLLGLGQSLDKSVLGVSEPCTGPYRLEPVSFAILEPFEFAPGAPHPAKGIWTLRYRFERCGGTVVYNAIFTANRGGVPSVFPTPPGTTRASTQLMKDVTPGLAIAAGQRNGEMKDCKMLIVTDTRVSREPHSLQAGGQTLGGVWEESWSLKTCAGPFTLDFCFVPEPTGGVTFTQSKCEPTQIATARSLYRKTQ